MLTLHLIALIAGVRYGIVTKVEVPVAYLAVNWVLPLRALVL